MFPSLSNLFLLHSVAQACTAAMPENTWWGLKFLDIKYLLNFGFSPHISVERLQEEYRVRISGSHEIDPGLTQVQIDVLEFLGWDIGGQGDCDCLFSPWGSAGEADEWMASALAALEVIFGISPSCAIVGSNGFVNSQIELLEGSRWNKKLGGYRLSSSQYNRSDLR